MKTSTSPTTRKIQALERALTRQHEELARLKRRAPPEPVAGYPRQTADGVDGWEPQYRY